MKLYVVRHGQVQSNVDGTVSGWNDERLTEKGIVQATQIKEKLQNIKFDVVYSSPVDRAKQTAEIVTPHYDIILDDRLAERNPGELLGKPRKSINKQEWNSLNTYRTKEGAETLASGLKRVKEFLDEIHSKYEDKTVLVVTHNFVSKCIWILENNIKSTEQINKFFHDNGEIKCYGGRQVDCDSVEK